MDIQVKFEFWRNWFTGSVLTALEVVKNNHFGGCWHSNSNKYLLSDCYETLEIGYSHSIRLEFWLNQFAGRMVSCPLICQNYPN